MLLLLELVRYNTFAWKNEVFTKPVKKTATNFVEKSKLMY